MLDEKPDLTLNEVTVPRNITLNIGTVTPGNLTLLEALDIAEAAQVDTDDFGIVISGKVGKRKQALLMYAMAWVLARRQEPTLTWMEVQTYQLTVIGKAATEGMLESEQKRAAAIAGVALLAGVSTQEAEDMTVAQVAAITSITRARRHRTARRSK
jgi:hypothetical protein